MLLSDNDDKMSDMASRRITIRIPEHLERHLRHRSRVKGQTESDLAREALEHYLGQPSAERSAYELAHAAGLIGIVKHGPKDLSTNRRHFEGFGKSNRRNSS